MKSILVEDRTNRYSFRKSIKEIKQKWMVVGDSKTFQIMYRSFHYEFLKGLVCMEGNWEKVEKVHVNKK